VKDQEDEIHVTSGCGVITLTQASEKSGRGKTGGYSGYFGGAP